MNFHDFASRAVGVPFREKGRDFDGWDCGGLLVACYREVRGIALPSHLQDYRHPKDALGVAGIVAAEKAARWRPVADPAAMDCVVLLIDRRPVHVGVMLDARSFLHVDRGIETCVEAVDGIVWRNRVEGFYRLVEARSISDVPSSSAGASVAGTGAMPAQDMSGATRR